MNRHTMTQTQQKILAAIRAGTTSRKAIAKAIGSTEASTARMLGDLSKQRAIRRVCGGANRSQWEIAS